MEIDLSRRFHAQKPGALFPPSSLGFLEPSYAKEHVPKLRGTDPFELKVFPVPQKGDNLLIQPSFKLTSWVFRLWGVCHLQG